MNALLRTITRRRAAVTPPASADAWMPHGAPDDAERAREMVEIACGYLRQWISKGTVSRPGGEAKPLNSAIQQFYSMQLGEADGAGTILRIAAAGDADGNFTAEALDAFRLQLDRWGDEVLNSLMTQSVVVSLLLTVLVPLMLLEVRYIPEASTALGEPPDATALFGDLASFAAPSNPPPLRRGLYVAECVLVSLSIACALRGLNLTIIAIDMLHALPTPIDKGKCREEYWFMPLDPNPQSHPSPHRPLHAA